MLTDGDCTGTGDDERMPCVSGLLISPGVCLFAMLS